MALLKDEALAAALGRRGGWQQTVAGICRTYEFADFFEAMKFVHRVADLAMAADRLPQIQVRDRRVTLTLASPEEGGVSDADITLAQRIDG